jgi:pilus assembly protein CpaE
LSVLAAPDRYTGTSISGESIERLLAVTRQDFDYVVVDAGSSTGPACRPVFDVATTVYLVTQVGISELRNANRFVSEFFTSRGKPQIVLNRFVARSLEIDEENITKALTMPANWKIPSDYPAVRNAQNTVVPLIQENSPISRVIRQMARVACGLPANPEKKKGFSLFG